jgi:hypothetical protein
MNHFWKKENYGMLLNGKNVSVLVIEQHFWKKGKG